MRKNLALSGSKKGNVAIDLIVVVIILFGMAVSTIIGYALFEDIYPDLIDNTTGNTEAIKVTDDMHTNYPAYMDGAFLLAFVLLYMFVLVSAWALDTHPLFFIFTIMLLTFVLIFGAIISNSFEEIVGDGDFGMVSVNFPYSSFILNNLVETLLVIGTSVALVLYGKSASGGGL